MGQPIGPVHRLLKPGHCLTRRASAMAEGEEVIGARFAKAAGAGELLNIHDLRLTREQAIGDQWLAQAKLMQPFHPRRDLAAQNAFEQKGCTGGIFRSRPPRKSTRYFSIGWCSSDSAAAHGSAELDLSSRVCHAGRCRLPQAAMSWALRKSLQADADAC
jgi:hypothetical protein